MLSVITNITFPVCSSTEKSNALLLVFIKCITFIGSVKTREEHSVKRQRRDDEFVFEWKYYYIILNLHHVKILISQ